VHFVLYELFLVIPGTQFVLLYLVYQGSLNSIIYFLCLSFETVNNVFWRVDPMLVGGREIGNCTTAVTSQRPKNNRGMVLCVWSVPSCYKQGSWSVGQSPVSKNVSTEA
jgi:hypothetical protein